MNNQFHNPNLVTKTQSLHIPSLLFFPAHRNSKTSKKWNQNYLTYLFRLEFFSSQTLDRCPHRERERQLHRSLPLTVSVFHTAPFSTTVLARNCQTLIFTILVGHFLASFLIPQTWNTCESPSRLLWTRENNPDTTDTAPVSIPTRTWLTEDLFRLLVVTLGFVNTLQTAHSKKSSRWVETGLRWFTHVLFYYLAIEVIQLLKRSSTDTACSGSPPTGNSPSGHTFYVIWAIMTLDHAKTHLRLPALVQRWCVIQAVLMGLQLGITITFGYHSLAQIMRGAVIGILFGSWTTSFVLPQ